MAQKKKTPLSDEAVMVLVNQKVKESVGWYDSRLSMERKRVIEYYNGTLPRKTSRGNSGYVSTDVYDAVESMKSQIIETFSANPDNLVSFPANGAADVEPSRIATEYCNYVVFRENDGFDINTHVCHDGLTARVGVVKVFWEKIYQDTEETLPQGASYQDVQSVAAQDDVTDLEANIDPGADPANPTFSGTLTRRVDLSKVTIEPVAPEEFLVSPRARNVQKADLTSHRTLKTKAELKDMGYSTVKVDALHFEDVKGADLGPEALARNAPVETAQSLDNPIQPEVEKVMLYESYVRMDMRAGKGVKLYKICHVADTLFAKEEVDRVPFIPFVPLPIAHLFYGNNFGARVIPTQNARTTLTRAILDHAATTTNPRWGVVKGGLINPKEMLENRQGGLVNMTRPDAVKALEQASLNPFVFQTIELLKANKEESTGISALSQGLNKDAISTQNSGALVDNLVSLSQGRQKIVARNFAAYLTALYLEVYRLVLENQDKEKAKIIEVAGAFIPVKTQDWVERTTCRVALHLGYGERDRATQKYAGLYQALSKDPAIAPMFLPANRFALLTDGMKSGSFENYAKYLTDPSTLPPPTPDPKEVAKQANEKSVADAALITAQSGALKNERLAEVAGLKEQLAELSMHMKAILGQRDADRKDADVQNRIDISQREMAVVEATPLAPADNAIVAPKG